MTAAEEDERWMRRALSLARAARATAGASPIGCVIVRDGVVIGEGHNEVGLRHDPTAHAEIVAIRRACESLGVDDLRGATLYSTLQPCGMCAMASIWTSIGRIVYGAERRQVHRMYFEDRDIGVLDIIDNAWRDDVRVRRGVLSEACATLYWQPGDDPPREEQSNI